MTVFLAFLIGLAVVMTLRSALSKSGNAIVAVAWLVALGILVAAFVVVSR